MDRRDQILAKLAVNLGLLDQAAVQRAVQMIQLTGHPLERVLVEGRMIDPAGYERLAQAFNHHLHQANLAAAAAAGQPPPAHPSTAPPPQQQAPAPQTAAPAPALSEDEFLAQPTMVLQDDDDGDELVVPDDGGLDLAVPSDEDLLLAQPTLVLTDSTPDARPPDATFQDEDALFAQRTIVLDDSADEDGGLEFALPAGLRGAGPNPAHNVLLVDSDEAPSPFYSGASDEVVVPSDSSDELPIPGFMSEEDALLAQPTMVLQDDSSDGLTIPDEDALLAQPTLVIDDSADGLAIPPSGEGLVIPDEEAILNQPTMVLDDEGGPDIYGQPTMVIQDDGLQLKSESAPPKRSQQLMPGVRSKKAGGPLNRDELQRRLKMRTGFEGFTVGDYKIYGEIARGAFGVVLEVEAEGVTGNMAKQRGYKGRMALKVALENKTDPRETERFIAETRVQISFDHPHIVKIFDCGVENGLTYYSMEKIAGVEARSHVLRHGPMPALLAMRVAKETAEALAYVHGRRIYHRDLKPQNILLDQSTQPYRAVLIDFGLVVETDSKDKGLIMGTPSYMPPEQAKPRGGFGKINVTSDIYSLGATLFFFLTGKAPFTGRDPRKIIKQVVTQPPPDPCALNPAIPRRVGDLVLKCLAKQQADRYHSAGLLVADLEKELRAGKMKLKAKNLLGRFGLGRNKK